MGKTYQSGIRTTKDRRGQIAPSPTGAVAQPDMQVTAVPPDRGRPIPRKNVQAGEPAGGKSAHRVQRFERHGAAFRVTVPLRGAQSPEAAATQANGRIIPSYPKTGLWSRQNFAEGQRSAN